MVRAVTKISIHKIASLVMLVLCLMGENTLVLGQNGEDRVRIAVPQLPAFKGIPFGRPFGGSPDPFTISAVFDALTFIDSAGQIQPLLAARWERLTPTRWRFHLRKQIRFSNGAPLTAKTIQRNLEHFRV